MTSVPNASGILVVPGTRPPPAGPAPPRPDAHAVAEPGGAIVCRRGMQDYVPAAEQSVALWLDAATGTGSGVARAPAAAGLSLAPRRGGGGFVAGAASYGLARQAGRSVPAFGPTSTGLAGTWGPLGGSWTLCLFLRADRLVNDYGDVLGQGPMTLLASPAVGLTLGLPSGGAVPASAVAANGGPLDGVAAGVPWDVPFLGQWRQLAVRHDAAGAGTRTVWVDGVPVPHLTQGVGPLPVPSGTALTLGAGCAVSLPEFLVWDALLTQEQLEAVRAAQRTKWEVVTLVRSPLVGPPDGTANVVAPAPLPLPAGVPAPRCWLDARDAGSLFRDSAGTQAAVANGRVRRWADRSGAGCHCTLPSASLLGGAMDRIAGVPVVHLQTAGTLATVPFGAAGFTVVAVWRLRAADGGHPLGTAVATLGPTQWCETLGVEVPRTVTEPPSAVLAEGEVGLGLWMRDAAGTVTWRLGGLAGATGGAVWTGSLATETGVWPTGPYLVGGAAGRGLDLAELLVWNAALDEASRALLQAHLCAKWQTGGGSEPPPPESQIPVRTNAVTTHTILSSLNAALDVVWDASVRTSLCDAGGAAVVGYDAAAVQRWRPTQGGTADGLRDLVAIRTGAYSLLYNNQPALFVGSNGNLLEGAADVPLLGRAVALVFRMSNRDGVAPDPIRAVLSRRDDVSGNGQFFLRYYSTDLSTDFGVTAGGIWDISNLGITTSMDTLTVCVFQVQQSGADVRLRRVTGPTTVSSVLMGANQTLSPNVPSASAVPLAVGGFRWKPRTATTGNDCGRDLVVHELRTYNRLLADAELLTVYNDLLDRWRDADVLVQWDASALDTLRTAAGAAVSGPDGQALARWRPLVGGAVTASRDLVAVATAGVRTVLYNNQPGVFLGSTGSLLEGAPDVPLLGRAVAIVFRMSNLDGVGPDPTKTVLARRDEGGANGQFFFRFSPSDQSGEYGAVANGGWASLYPAFTGAMDTLMVCVFQLQQTGSDIRVRRVAGATTVTEAVVGAGRTLTALPPATAPVPLTLGGWRNKPRTATTGSEGGKDLVVHELRVYSRLLADAELLAAYNALLNRWRDDDVVVRWDASAFDSLRGPAGVAVTAADGQAVSTWKPVVGGAATTGRDLVALRSGACTVAYGGRPGLFVGSNGNVLEGAADVPLLGRTVALAFRMSNRDGVTPDQTKTVLARRDDGGANGQCFFRFNPGDQSAEFAVAANGGFSSLYPAYTGALNVLQVAVFHIYQSGLNIRVKRASNATTVSDVLLVGSRTLTLNTPATAPVPLTLGGWRGRPRTATVGNECGKDLVVHELRILSRALADAEMLALYNDLVGRWS